MNTYKPPVVKAVFLANKDSQPTVVQIPWEGCNVSRFIPDRVTVYRKRHFGKNLFLFVNFSDNPCETYAHLERPKETTNLFGLNGPILFVKHVPPYGDVGSFVCDEIAEIFDVIERQQIRLAIRKDKKKSETVAG